MIANDILAGLIMVMFTLIVIVIKIGVVVAIAWAIWNWVIMPSLPYIMSLI